MATIPEHLMTTETDAGPTHATSPDLDAPPRPTTTLPGAHAHPPTGVQPALPCVVLEADDLGLLHAFNEGIRRAHSAGCLTSTCLRANGYAYEHAVHDVLPACPELGVGIHLCLNEAACVAPPGDVPLLLSRGRHLRAGFRWLMKLARSSVGRVQIERELRAQIDKVLADGVRVDHLNSHQHVHMIPEIFRITCRLAREYGVPCVRLAREPFHLAGPLFKRIEPFVNANYAKHVLLNRFARDNALVAADCGVYTMDRFIGINYTGRMDLRTVVAGLIASAGSAGTEVLLHPTIGPDPRDTRYPRPYLRAYTASAQRTIELDTLLSDELRDALTRGGWRAVTFSTWLQGRDAGRPDMAGPRGTSAMDRPRAEPFEYRSARLPTHHQGMLPEHKPALRSAGTSHPGTHRRVCRQPVTDAVRCENARQDGSGALQTRPFEPDGSGSDADNASGSRPAVHRDTVWPAISDETRALCRAVVTTNPPWVSAAYPDSRAFAELAVTLAPAGARALDVGTGTGIVAICLASAGLDVTATDVSAAAVRSAADNARRNGVRLRCRVSDLLESIRARFDWITINPPYNFVPDTFAGNLAKNLLRRIPAVHRNSGRAMPRAVQRFRNRLIRRFIEQAPDRLRPGGRLFLLVYDGEVEGVRRLLPPCASVRLYGHPDLRTVGTVGMLIRMTNAEPAAGPGASGP